MGFENLKVDEFVEFTEVVIDLNKIMFIDGEIDINNQDTKEIFDTFKEPSCKKLVIKKYDSIYYDGFTETEIIKVRSIFDKIFDYMTINYHVDNLPKIKRYFEYQLLSDEDFADNFTIIYFNNKIYDYVLRHIFVIEEIEIDIDFHINTLSDD